jgi:hypothetical protein
LLLLLLLLLLWVGWEERAGRLRRGCEPAARAGEAQMSRPTGRLALSLERAVPLMMP